MSIFNTTANTQFNSFGDPLNPTNVNGGGWGMDSNYLTPAFSASYRPGYGGPNGTTRAGYDPGFFRSATELLTPAGATYNYGDPSNNYRPLFESIHTRPADAAMWAMQNVATPVAAMYAVNKALSFQVANRNAFLRSTIFNSRFLTGSSAAEAAASARTIGLGAAIGERAGFSVGSGLARGFGASAATAARIGTGMGVVGAAASSVLLPFAITQAAMSGVNALVFDPYTNQRRTGRDLRDMFENVSMGDNSTPTGKGLSFSSSNRIARDIMKMGIQDYTFNQEDMQAITKLSAQHGLLDSTTAKNITSKIKEVKESLKAVMVIAKEGDLGSAMEILAQLKSAGAGTGQVAERLLSKIGSAAAISGISAQRMMNTVGAQGQYMFQANGLTPMIGQLTAANLYAGAAAAYRTGVIGDSALARMGGIEGMTQSSMTAMVNGGQTPYNRVRLFNEYMGAGRRGDVVGNLINFGNVAARDPLSAAGRMGLYGPQMISADLAKNGIHSLDSQIAEQARLLGKVGPNGKVDPGAYFMIGKSMGLSESEMRAFMSQAVVDSDPRVTAYKKQAISNDIRSNEMGFAEQNGFGYGILTKPYRMMSQAWKNLKEGTSSAGSGFLGASAGVTDSFRDFWMGRLGSTAGSQQGSLTLFNTDSFGAGRKYAGYNGETKVLTPDEQLLKAINSLARSGNSIARDFIGGTSPAARSKAMYQLIESSALSSGAGQYVDATVALAGRTGTTTTTYQNSSMSNLMKSLNSISAGGQSSSLDKLSNIGSLQAIWTKYKGRESEAFDDPEVQRLMKAYNVKSVGALMSLAENATRRSNEEGLTTAASVVNQMGGRSGIMSKASADPEAFFGDKQAAAKFRSLLKSGSAGRKAAEDMAYAKVASSTDGAFDEDLKRNAGRTSWASDDQFLLAKQAQSKASSRITKANVGTDAASLHLDVQATKSLVDSSSTMEKVAQSFGDIASDMKDAVLNFTKAVDKFSNYQPVSATNTQQSLSLFQNSGLGGGYRSR